MKRVALLLALPLLLLFGCGGTDAWTHYNTPDFSIDFPSAPKDTSTLDGGVATEKVILEASNNPLDDNAYYEVAIAKTDLDLSQFADSVFVKSLVSEAQLSAALMGGQLLNEAKPLKSGPYRGAEFHINMAGNAGLITMRKYVTPTHIYTLKVITTNARVNNPMIGKFMNSFVIKTPAPKKP